MKKTVIFTAFVLLALLVISQVYAGNKYQTFFNKTAEEKSEFEISNERNIQLQSDAFNIADDDAVMGNPTAPVTMVEFGGFEETFSRRFWRETFPLIKTEYVDTAKLKFVFRDFPLVELFPGDGIAALATECVHLQGGNSAYFQMWNALYATDQIFDEEIIQRIALNVGYDITDCLESGATIDEVVLDITDALLLGVEGSPTFFINEQIVSGAHPYNIFQDLIEQELNENVACFSNNDCDDSNLYTYDTCINSGESNAECRHQEIRCFDSNDCGNTIITKSCLGDSLCTNRVSYICNNPRTPQSSCSSSVSNSCNNCQFGCNNQTLMCQASPVIRIYSPFNNKNHNTRPIQINLSAGNYVFDEISYIDWNNARPRWVTLCRNCNEYGFRRKSTKSFSDGAHNLTFKAAKNGINIQNNVSFFIDSKMPRILRTLPRSNSFAYGEFYIKYSEDNCKELVLNIYSASSSLKENLPCESGANIEKYFLLDNLNSYNNQEVEYQFIIRDIANNTAESRKTKVKVDTISPLINSFVNMTNGRRVTFILNITEPNFDEVSYIDWNDSNPREKTLCSSLRNSICSSTKTFRNGNHDITIFIIDKAGNDASIDTRFVI